MKWISVEEQLPSQTYWVLVSDGQNVDRGEYDVDWWVVGSEIVDPQGITHWMPLPKPPEVPNEVD
jgi:hypothetical protein